MIRLYKPRNFGNISFPFIGMCLTLSGRTIVNGYWRTIHGNSFTLFFHFKLQNLLKTFITTETNSPSVTIDAILITWRMTRCDWLSWILLFMNFTNKEFAVFARNTIFCGCFTMGYCCFWSPIIVLSALEIDELNCGAKIYVRQKSGFCWFCF